jgi:protein O-mannosyl-transferase
VMNNPFYGMDWSDKMATIFYTLLLYLKLHIFPHPLTHDYYPYQIPKMTWAAWQSILSLVLHIGLGIVILRGWRKKSIWAYTAAFYLIALSIVSNIFVSVGTFMNDRFVYHASLGVCLALAYFFTEKMAGLPLVKKIGLGLATLLFIGFCIKTISRVPDWRNGASLNTAAIKYSPNSARANCFYAVSIWENQYVKLDNMTPPSQRKALLDSMRYYFDKSVQILPQYQASQKMRAGIASEYHKMDKNDDALLASFNEINKSGVYVDYVLEYLKYINSSIYDRTTALKFEAYYKDMVDYYKRTQPTTILPVEYQKLLTEIQARIELLK